MQQTDQPREEKKRMSDFLKATHRGALETLMFQSEKRQADMLPDPDNIRRQLIHFKEMENPNIWVVDQLSYSVTLALYSLRNPLYPSVPVTH